MKKRYSIGGQIFEIPDTEVNAFLKDNPNATEVKFYSVSGKDYNIPLTEVEDFEKEMGIKKKELVGGTLSFAGGQVGNGKAPLKEDVSAVEDPAKYLLQPYRERKTAAEKEYQKNVPIGGYNLMAIPKADTKQQYDAATKDLTNMEEQVFNKLFPDTRHAISYIQQKYDQSGGKVPEDNETFKIALQKVNQRRGLDEIVAKSNSIEDAAAKYYGENFNDLPDIKKGKYLRSFLNRPEVKEKADEGGQFLHDYNVAKGTLISKYPQDALQKIATDISQELEDKKMTNWFYSNPSVDKTDKAIQQLVDDGKISLEEKNLYDKALRPVIEAGGADVVLKTSDLLHGIGRGLYHGMENIDATLRDITNRVTGGTFQKAGLIETNEERRKRLEQERLSETELQPKGGRKFLTEASEFAGFSIPMIFGSMAKVPQAMNMALMFEGANADKARELFKDDAGKQDLYTLLSTGADMYIMKLLPTKKFAEGAKNLFAKDISGLINELGSGKITQEQASKTFLDNLTNYAKKVGVTNFETANALTAFQLAHNTIDAAFGKRDFNLENEVKEALTNYKTNFLSGTFLSMVGAAPKSNEINTNGKILRELADRSEQILPEIKNDAEKTKNLQTAIQINNELKTRNWNEDAKNRFMASAMKESVLKEKQKTAPTEALKKQSEEELDRAKKTQEAILAGKNPDEVKTDNEIELERLQKDKELADKDFEAKRKQLDGRTPEDRPKIEKLEEDKKRAEEDYQREVEKLTPKIKPEETFPEGENIPSEEKIPEQQPQAISSGEVKPTENEATKIEVQQSPEVKEPTTPEPNKEIKPAEEGTGEPPKEPTEPVGEEGGEGVGITHTQTKELAQEFGLSEYEKSPETFEKWDREAEERIKKGEMPKLIQRLKNGEIPSSVEQRMMGKYIAELAAKAEKDASDENLNNLHEAIKLSDVIGGREAGKTLVSRKGAFLPDDSLAAYFELERTSNLDAPLTDIQKEKAKTEWERISKAKEDFEKYVFEKESEISAKMAAAKIAEARKGVTSTKAKEKRSHEDFKKERDSYREELKKAKEAHEQWLKEQGIQKQGFGFTLTTDMVKAIAKIVKSHVEEGVQKLEEIIEKVYEDLKDIFPAIEKKDIQDVIAGVYNEKKPPRKELARKLFELRQQAQLISKLEKLYAGEEPKSEKKKVQRNQEIEKLRKQIKDIESFDTDVKKIKEEEAKVKATKATEVEKELNKAEKEGDKKEKDRIAAEKLEEKMLSKEMAYRTPEEKALEKYKNATTKRIGELEEQLRTGDFEKTTKKIPIQLDRQGRELQHKLIKLKTERQIRLMKQEYQNRSKVDKARDWVADKLNVPRTIMSSMDFSAPLRQGLVAAISHPRTATLAGLQMFKSAFSKKNFDKWVYENRESPRFDIQNQSGLAITDPHSPYLAAKEEAFMNNTAEKIPLIGRLIAGSERAYVMFLNKMRVDLFNRFADRFEEQGKTFENSPELYKAMAKLINAETGRGDLGKALEGAAPILNSAFFSPRLIASRVNLLSNWANPYWYKRTPKEIRIMYLKDMLKTVGLGMSVLMLARLNGAQVEDDPRSTDFGKIKSGNTRWDVWGGFQQYVRLVTQLVLGQKKAATTGAIQELDSRGKFGESRGDVALRFLRGKLAPVPSMLMDWSAGRTATGEKVTLGNELESHFTPLLYSDIKDAWKDKGVRSVFEVGIPSMFGVGVQTFAPRPPSAKTITVSDITGLNERQATPEEYKKYQDEVEKKFKEQLTSYEKGEIEVPISLVKSEQFPKGKPVLMTSDNWSGKTIPYKELDEESKKYFQRILKNPISKQVRENMKMKTDEEEQ